MTPEGHVKKDIRDLLYDFGLISAGAKQSNWPPIVTGWYFMPVPNGLGVHGIPDFIGFYKGKFFAVEAKAPGKERDVSANQENRIREIRIAFGHVVVADSVDPVRKMLLAIDEVVGGTWVS